MDKYIKRLIACGYSPDKAVKVCEEFERNLGMLDLELFVQATEEYHINHVDKIQPQPHRSGSR